MLAGQGSLPLAPPRKPQTIYQIKNQNKTKWVTHTKCRGSTYCRGTHRADSFPAAQTLQDYFQPTFKVAAVTGDDQEKETASDRPPVSCPSVQFTHSAMSNSLQPHGLQHARLPCPSPIPRGCSNSCPSSQWCHPTILSSVVPFSSYLQSFPASESFPMSQFFSSGGESTGVSASVLPMNIQDWFPLGLIGWLSLLAKGLSRVFSNTTVQKHQFFGAQLSL